jgi:hypothetical protein
MCGGDGSCTKAAAPDVRIIRDVELVTDVGEYARAMADAGALQCSVTVEAAMAWKLELALRPRHAGERCSGTTKKTLRRGIVESPCMVPLQTTLHTDKGQLPPIAVAEFATVLQEPSAKAIFDRIAPEESLTVNVGTSRGRYELVALAYHETSPLHFVSQFSYKGAAYFHDGLKNNGHAVVVGSRIDAGYGLRNSQGCAYSKAVYALRREHMAATE